MSPKSELWTLDNYHTFIFHVIIYWSPLDIRIIDLSLSSIPAEAVLAACVGDVNGPTAHSQLTARRAAIPGLRESEESCGAWGWRVSHCAGVCDSQLRFEPHWNLHQLSINSPKPLCSKPVRACSIQVPLSLKLSPNQVSRADAKITCFHSSL